MLKKFIITPLLLLSCGQASATWYFQPEVGFEILTYEVTIGENDDPLPTATIPRIIAGATLMHSSGWYLDAKITGGDGEIESFFPEVDYIERSDTTVSTGIGSRDGFILFIGINQSKTTIENRKQQANQSSTFEFTSNGYFIGLAKNILISYNHTLTFAAALAQMEGSYNSLHDSNPDLIYEAEGDATGLTASASYTYRILPRAALTLGIKIQSYLYTEMIDTTSQEQFSDTNEALTNTYMKVSYTF